MGAYDLAYYLFTAEGTISKLVVAWVERTCDLPDLDYPQVLVSPRPEEIETSIVAYVLRNTPLRLVRTSTLTPEADAHSPAHHEQNDDPSASLVTLDMILTELPEITLNRLSLIPDDQLLFFWAESAHFFLSPSPPSNHSSDRGRPVYDEKDEYCGDVGPLPGEVGAVDDGDDEPDSSSGNKSPTTTNDTEGTSNNNQRAEFIALRRFTYICLVLQVKRREGIVYRINIGQIDAQAWRRSRPRRELVPVGVPWHKRPPHIHG